MVSAKRSLIWLLIWCLMVEPMAASIARAQVPPTPVPSTTSDDAADDAADHAVQQLVDRGEALNRDLETQIRRVKHPGTPGTQAGTPTSFDVGALEARILAFRQEAEAGLALPQLPQADGSPYWAVDLKLTVVNQYFNLLKELINLRMVMGLGHGDGWRQGFDLRMPAQALRQLPGMGVANDPKAGDTFFPMVFVPGPADGQVSLRLSKSLIRGMELGRLTDSPDQANFLTMVQYLAVRQLMQNLSEIKYVRRDHQMTWPEFPSDFTHKLESFGVMDDLEAEQEVALLEPALRTNLQRQFENIKAQLPPIVDDAFCGSMADVILGGGTAEEDRQELSGLLCSSMREAEDKNLAAYLNQEFTSASEILELQNGPELRDSLRFILMNARVNVILRKLLAMNSAHVISVPLSIRRALMPLVETRRGWMSAGTPDSVLDGWGHAAKTALESYVYDQRRAEFIENLYVQARSVGAIYDHRVGDDYVDLPVLSSSLAKKIEKRSPKQATRGWIADVAGAGDYAAARDRYAAIMAEQTYPGVLRDGGVVDPGLVKLYTDVADLRPHPDTSGIALECTATPGSDFLDCTTPQPQAHSGDLDPQFEDYLLDSLQNSRRKSIEDFSAYGDWMGFNHWEPYAHPKVSDILTDSDDRKEYDDQLKDSLFSQYPVLTADVSTDSGTMPLHRALAALSDVDVVSQDILERASTLVDQALDVTEAKVKDEIEKVAKATDLMSIERVVNSSLMLQLVMNSFPEFRRQQQAFVDDLMTPSLMHQIMRRHVSWYVSYGFAALILIHGVGFFFKRARPFTAAVEFTMKPFIQGYMATATALIIAQTAYDLNELMESRHRDQETNELFQASIDGGGFYSYGEQQAAHSEYQWTKWMFIGRLAMDTLFMYLPMTRGVLTRMGDRVVLREFLADIRAFRDLGIEPGEWTKLDEAMQKIREGGQAVHPDRLASAERAYRRLADKVRAGRDWDLSQIESPEPISKVDQRIRKMMLRLGRIKK